MERQSNLKIGINIQSPKNNFVKEILRRAQLNNIDISEDVDTYSDNLRLKLLYISPQKGFIRPCPCSKKYRCCGYFTIDTIEGCIFECEYCILRSFIDSSKILIKADVDEMLSELNQFTSSLSKKGLRVRIGTGELSDSLALEHIIPFAPILIETTKNTDKVILEFKTKSDNVEEILELPHHPLTTISFSMTSTYLHQRLEIGTSSPTQRLLAAKRCTAHSYRVGFHFDPIIYYRDYVQDYEMIIRELASLIPLDAISWISLGTIRFNPIMLDKFTSDLLFGEYIMDKEKKMRYPLRLRIRMYKTILDLLRTYLGDKIKVYLCMELDMVNELILGKKFENNYVLSKYITNV
ncbi:MAG: hypothetical protein N2746_05400 [Deltaproteobacteria bacterium]|nr:hypothetical protein [Deltaproteobacteria bacterium]